MDIIKKILNRETVFYLFFGVVATLLNMVLFHLFINVIGMNTFIGNGLDTVICVLFQYFTNRIWVFRSRTTGKRALKEFVQFVSARGITAVIDQIIVVIGIDIIVYHFVDAEFKGYAAIGVKLISSVVVVILNYVFSKMFVFKREN